MASPPQRPALGVLFAALAAAFGAVAAGAAWGAGASVGRWVVAAAATSMAVWLAPLAWAALAPRRRRR